MSSDFKNTFVFNWTVERPVYGSPKISPSSHMSGMNFYFVFSNTLNKYEGTFFNLYTLDLRTTGNVPMDSRYALEVTVDIKNKHKMNVSQLAISRTFGIEEVPAYIWAKSEEKVLNHIPNFISEGIVTFVITITRPVVQCKDMSIQTPSHLNNLTCLENLSEDFSKLLNNDDSKPDVVMVCGEQTAHAHSLILSSRSDVLAATLRNDMTEKRTDRIEIRDMDPEHFQIFVRYLYTGTLPSDMTVEMAMCLFEAGDRNSVKGLVKRCALFLEENLNVENACEFLLLADRHNHEEFKENVLSYIVENEVIGIYSKWVEFSKNHSALAVEVFNRFYLLI